MITLDSTLPAAASAGGSSGSSLQPLPALAAVDRDKICLRRILVPTVFSAASSRVLDYARRLAQQFGAHLVFLHVIQPEAGLRSEKAARELCARQVAAEKLLRRWLALLGGETAGDDEPPCEAHFVCGSPAEEIVKVARLLDCDLIVIAAREHGDFTRLLLGSTTESVVRRAPCPVIVIREKAHRH